MCSLELQILKGQEHQSCLSILIQLWLLVAAPSELHVEKAWESSFPLSVLLCCGNLLILLRLTPASLTALFLPSCSSLDLLRGLFFTLFLRCHFTAIFQSHKRWLAEVVVLVIELLLTRIPLQGTSILLC